MKIIDATFPPPPDDKEDFAALVAWFFDVLIWLVGRIAVLEAERAAGLTAEPGGPRTLPPELKEALRAAFADRRGAAGRAGREEGPTRKERAILLATLDGEAPPGEEPTARDTGAAPADETGRRRAPPRLPGSGRANPATAGPRSMSGPLRIFEVLPAGFLHVHFVTLS